MTNFIVHLQSSTQFEKLTDVIAFGGEDSTGKFSLLAHHGRMMTCLSFGIAYIRYENNEMEYLAVPGGLLYFIDNQLILNTSYYLRNKDYQAVENALDTQLRIAEENVGNIKAMLRHLDEEMLKRLWELKRQGHYESY